MQQKYEQIAQHIKVYQDQERTIKVKFEGYLHQIEELNE